MAENTAPTDANTVAEIKSWLDAQGIAYNASATKAELLALVPAQEEPAQPVVPEPVKYSKEDLVSLSTGSLRIWFKVALKSGVLYTYAEALALVDKAKKEAF